ncbi:MAG: trypsin-like peptidase domain-containing protein, partial [Clostridia bacterium]|nr:trypsin-like peptidase domain-containing protein [Clostridia bacterium]
MKKLRQVLLCIISIALFSFSAYATMSVPKPVMQATESVVRILAEYAYGYSTGSGFVIKSDKEETLIVTNYHVVKNKPYNISVWLSEDETISATILAYTTQKDMCVLKLAHPISLKPLPFAENGAKQGDVVYAVGFPGAADYLSDKEAHTSADATITDGIVSAQREATVSSYGTPTKMLQINAAINSGNSGGPLFNTAGEVVGINTYVTNNSQGIFGAIAINELIAFIADNAITLPEASNLFPLFIVSISTVVITAAIFSIIIVRKKKMKTVAKVANIPLREYMSAYPDGIGISDAVAMLLPVALHLRDLHNTGDTHLQVSPNSVFVGAGGASLSSATASEADRYSNGYAAPEIYKGTPEGSLSDIYSFCALLLYVALGKQPENSLSRTQVDAITCDDAAFANLINTGLSPDPTHRFASMQDVIIRLSPYNIHPFVFTAESGQDSSYASAEKKAKSTRNKNILIAIIVLFIVLLTTYIGCYVAAKVSARNGEFDTADNLLFAVPITAIHDARLVDYIKAGKLLNARSCEDAKAAFENISGYMNADELAKESEYRHAIQYADANEFDKAVSLMSELEKLEYKDSSDKVLEFQYRKGIYLLTVEENFAQANKIFTNLVAKNYDGADKMQKET